MDRYEDKRNYRQRMTLGLTVLAMLGLGAPAMGGGLASHGPLNQFGYPSYYTDANGLSLSLQTNFNDPLLNADVTILPDRLAPLDVRTGNFYEESFYHDAVARIDLPNQGRALCVMALEAMFFGPLGEVIEGEQAVMGRLRVRVDVTPNLANMGIYTITTPYGTFFQEVTLADFRKNRTSNVINFTNDSIFIMGPGEKFTTPLDPNRSDIGPAFLVWDSGAPVGYVGDPGVEHTVTGSPTGQNYFRIDGPNIGGPGINFIETDLFFVAGQIVPPDQIFVDANGNEINDSLDIVSGFSRDCNGNGIPDEVDMVTKIEVGSPQMLHFGAGFPKSVTIAAGTARANSEVIISITASGDFASPLEGYTLDLNGIFVADSLFVSGHDCATNIPDTSKIFMDSVTYNTIVGTGDAVFTLTPSIDSDADYCGTGFSYASINIQYTGPSPLDLNQDGILDSCVGAPLMGPRPELDRRKRGRGGLKK